MLLFYADTKESIECPVTHPYAFKQGRNCCKTNKEDAHPNDQFECNSFFRHPHCDVTCDGSDISIHSNCCENEAFVRCAEGKFCINGNENGGKLSTRMEFKPIH